MFKVKIIKQISRWSTSRKAFLGLVIGLITYWWFFSLPVELFDMPTSTAIYSSDDQLLGATIATDGQWRFPLNKDLPEKFSKSVVGFEDERFYYHPGIDIFSIGRAMLSNIKEKRIVSGASTLSMQVIRLHRVDKPRIWSEKIIEMFLALRLECRYSKKEILALWSAHAPFGGNVVGLEAAAWRYYGRPPVSLSWGEATTLAVLPNAPTIIHPGKNRNALLQKRNRLLLKLVKDEVIDSMTAELASLEPLPDRPKPMPQAAPHLLMHARANGFFGERVQTTIDNELQLEVKELLKGHHNKLRQNQIHNAAVLVLDVKKNEIITYLGNSSAGKDHGEDVDISRAPRSSGSILKPLLYASMNQEGILLPCELVPDVPTQIAGYRPKNFHDKYDGAVPADAALSRSLNIPAVRELQEFGVEKFHHRLRKMGFSTINREADHYGLSLVLGGAEVTLWDLTRTYGSMARILNKYHDRNGEYHAGDWSEINYVKTSTNQDEITKTEPILDAASIYITMQALTSVKRPSTQFGWNQFTGARRVAWKTGTSIGFRDAWAVGITPEYVVAVWIGNADGEGRPELVGVKAAAPLLFDIFKTLPPTSWFEAPHDELRDAKICRQSGLKAGPNCRQKDIMQIHKNGRRSLPCSYHKKIFTDANEEFIVNAGCMPSHEIKVVSRFVLPPAMAYYYRQQHTDYDEIPPPHPNCQSTSTKPIEIIYPQARAMIKVPVDIEGNHSQAVFEVAHEDADATIFWHVDDVFIGQTENLHSLAMNPSIGAHTLKVVDKKGNELTRRFEVVR